MTDQERMEDHILTLERRLWAYVIVILFLSAALAGVLAGAYSSSSTGAAAPSTAPDLSGGAR